MNRNLAWVLPRPSKSKYKGSFPLYFESRLLDLLKIPTSAKIVHPFGGNAEYGIRVDINPETEPDFIGNANDLNMFENNTFDLVILDPPYSDTLSTKMYGTGSIKFESYTSEAVRICKELGYIVVYHCLATPRIPYTRLVWRIFIETRIWHLLRCVHIYQKDTTVELGLRGQSEIEMEIEEQIN